MIQVISEKELNIDNDLNELRAKDVYSNESQKPLLDKPLSENLAIAENNQQKDMNIV